MILRKDWRPILNSEDVLLDEIRPWISCFVNRRPIKFATLARRALAACPWLARNFTKSVVRLFGFAVVRLFGFPIKFATLARLALATCPGWPATSPKVYKAFLILLLPAEERA